MYRALAIVVVGALAAGTAALLAGIALLSRKGQNGARPDQRR